MYRHMVNIMPLSMVDDLLDIARCGLEYVAPNAHINVQIELKSLKLHTQDKAGKSICHQMHIGKPNHTCPKLQVHGTKLGQVSEDTYLGCFNFC